MITMVSSPGCEEWKNLIPELLLGLVGCGGGAFVYTRTEKATVPRRHRGDDDDDDGCGGSNDHGEDCYAGLVLSEVIDWVSDAEREQFNRLAKLGWYYHRLSQYATTACSVIRNGKQMPYHAAVGQGVLEVLDVYRQAVLKIEGCLVDGSSGENLWSLLPLEHALAEFFQLFPFLDKSIEYICTRAEGCEIIHVFEKAAQSGVPIVDGCALRIAWHCYQVLFKQMYVWMIRGKVVDPTGDFFIRMEEEEEEEGHRPGGMYDMVTAAKSSKYVAAHVVESRLPSSISMSLANDVLYVGQCTRILASLSQPGAYGDMEYDSAFATSLKEVCTSRRENIDWIALKKRVHAQKLSVSARVWKEMHSADRNLQGHINDLVDVLLQNRGSLYAQVMLHMATFVSRDPDRSQAPNIASHIFQEALYSDSLDGTSSTEECAFTMTWYDATNPECVLPIWHPHYDEHIFLPSFDAWDGLIMRYDVKWPMHLIFPPHIMRVYVAFWQLMFRITRSLDQLKNIRYLLYGMNQKKIVKEADIRDRKIRMIYHQLYRLMSTYAHHLHVEVVARSNDVLQNILESSTSLIDAESKHMKFVTEIVETSCMDIRQVMGVFENMFSCVGSMASMAQKDGSVITEGTDTSLEKLHDYFWTKYNVLYQLLQSNRLQSGRRGEAIRRLLLKLNYNGFLDANATKQMDTHQLHIT